MRSGHVEDVVNDLEEHAQFACKGAEVRNCRRFFSSGEEQYAFDARRDQSAGLKFVQAAQSRRPVGRGLGDVDVLASHHALNARGGGELTGRRQQPRRLGVLL